MTTKGENEGKKKNNHIQNKIITLEMLIMQL